MSSNTAVKGQFIESTGEHPWKLPIIDRWYVCRGHLMGIVRNHPKLPDGTYISTSKLQCMGEYLALTHSNHWYQLGNQNG